MALIKVQTASERISTVRRRILNNNRQINTLPGSVAGDLFVVPLALSDVQQQAVNFFVSSSFSPSELLALKQDANNVALIAQALNVSADDVLTSISQAIDVLAANVSETRLAAKKASGTVLFMRSAPPTSDITVPAGKVVRASNGAQFITTADVTLFGPPVDPAIYINTEEDTFSIPAPVEAVEAGTTSNAPAGTIVDVLGPVANLPFVTNTTSIQGGTDLETDEDLVARILNKWQAVGTTTKQGVINSVLKNVDVQDVFLADAGSAFSVRGYGKADMFIKAIIPEQVSETFSVFNHPTIPSAIHPSFLPLISIVSVTAGLANLQRQLSGSLSGSVRALDAIRFTSTPFPGSVTITYLYNRAIRDTQNVFDDTSLAPLNYQKPVDGITASETSLLVKEAARLISDYTATVQTLPGEDIGAVIGEAKARIAAYNSALNIGEQSFLSDINEIIEQTPGVLRLAGTPSKFAPSDESGTLSSIKPTENQVVDLVNVNLFSS